MRQAEVLHGRGLAMAEAIRQLGISEVAFHRWRKAYGGMSGDQPRRLKELEKENERLGRAGLRPDDRQADPGRGGPGKLLSPSGRRRYIDRVRDRLGVSERRACRVLAHHRSTQRQVPRGRDEKDRLVADAEAHLTRRLFGDMLRRIWALPVPGG